jgi:nucleoside-diphosphate-sugar epimerase
VVYSGAGCAVAEKTFDDARPTQENDPISLEMDSPYSISKIVGEYYAVYFYRQHGLPTVRARFQNVYGPGEVLGAGQWRGTPATVWRNVTPTFIYKALQGQELPVENKGVASRDFIYVDDIVEGLILCAVRGAGGEVYNLASGAETTINELAELINQLTDNPSPVKYLPGRDWDRSGKRVGCAKKSKEQLGFQANTSLKDGLKKTIEWTKTHLDFIEKTMRKHGRFLPLL